MTVSNYELANRPYTRGFGDDTTTVVEIRLQDGNRYSTNQRVLSGDRTNEPEDVLIQAVLDILKAELDPGAAIVKAQAQLQEAEQKLAQAEVKQTATDQAVQKNKEEADRFGKISHALVLAFITGKLLPYGTTYKILADLIPTAEVGKGYMANDLIALRSTEKENGSWFN